MAEIVLDAYQQGEELVPFCISEALHRLVLGHQAHGGQLVDHGFTRAINVDARGTPIGRVLLPPDKVTQRQTVQHAAERHRADIQEHGEIRLPGSGLPVDVIQQACERGCEAEIDVALTKITSNQPQVVGQQVAQ